MRVCLQIARRSACGGGARAWGRTGVVLRDGAGVDALKDGHLDTGDVIHSNLDALLSGADRLDDHRLNVAGGVFDLGEGEVAVLEGHAHVILRLRGRRERASACVRPRPRHNFGDMREPASLRGRHAQ